MKITEYKKKNGDTVYRASVYLGVDVTTKKKVRTTVTATTKKGVKRKAREAVNRFIANGSTIKPKPTIKTYKELAELWWDSYKDTVKPNTVITIRGFLNNHILPVFGDYRLTKINTPLIQKQVNVWANQANNGKKGALQNYRLLHNINNRILQLGVSLQVMTSNPARDVIVPRKKQKDNARIKYLTNQQLKQFLGYLDNLDQSNFTNLFDVVLAKTLIATGCRIGEALALEWSDINLDDNVISITKTLNHNQKTNSPKSKSGIRDVTIDKKTALMLKQYKKRQQVKAWELGQTESIVFSNFISGYPKVGSLRYRLEKHFKLANVPNVGFHGLRHTHATMMLYAGIQPKDLQARLGHSNISMTLNTYVHASKEGAKKAVSFFETAIASL